MKHGLTLIEIVLAVALLAALGAGLSVWINMTSTLATQSRHTLDWRQSAEAAMRLLADDLLIGDLTESDLASRLVIDVLALTITTRSRGAGPVGYRYELDTASNWLTRRPSDEPASPSRRLVGDVSDFQAIFLYREGDEDDKAIGIELTIASTEGLTLTRRFILP